MIFFAGLLVLFFSIVYILFFLLARQKQNALLYTHRKMKNEFETQLLQAKIETQDEALSFVAKELHDNVGQLLNSAKLLAGVCKKNPVKANEIIDIIDETLAQTIKEIRSLSKSLSKEWLTGFSLIENLNAEIKRINYSGQIKIEFNDELQLEVPNNTQLVLFRIVQEAIQNVIKHASANLIVITMSQSSELLKITLSDNGQGITKEVQDGMGMANMKHRTRLLGGTIEWLCMQRGTTIEITLPIKTLIA
ncbi:MAG: hypothetical protein JWN76_465 [Chitinophagaceae bacterium]|nr:hypothetical protein [Chitinophagaceae bacterium]